VNDLLRGDTDPLEAFGAPAVVRVTQKPMNNASDPS
jgi:hypothetical protein